MFFAAPFFFWLFPVVFIPFLIDWLRRQRRLEIELPSLFFAQQLSKKTTLRVSNRNLWEPFLESFFLLLIVLLLARPTMPLKKFSKQKLLVFVDDSPSMRYALARFGKDPLYDFLSEQINEKNFQELWVAPLSQISLQGDASLSWGSFSILNSIGDLRNFYLALKTLAKVAPVTWESADFLVFRDLLSQFLGPLEKYEMVFYSDFKQNHFSASKLELDQKSTFPFSDVYLLQAPLGPYISGMQLPWKNYFHAEALPLEIKLFFEPPLAQSFFLTLFMGNEVLFQRKVDSLKRVYQPNVVVQKNGLHPIKAVLSFGEEPIDTIMDAIYVYDNFSISLPFLDTDSQKVGDLNWKQAPTSQADKNLLYFFKSIFKYDVDKGRVAFSPNGEFVFVTDILNFPVDAFSRKKKYMVFLEKDTSLIALNKKLHALFPKKTLQFETLVVPSKKSKLVDLSQPNTLLAQKLGIDHFFTLPSSLPEEIIPLFRIDDFTVGFKWDNIFFFSFLGRDNFLLTPNPVFVAWIYEALFSLQGKKIFRVMQNAMPLLRQSIPFQNHPPAPLGKQLFQNEKAIYLPSRNDDEFKSVVIKDFSAFFPNAKLVSKNTFFRGDVSWNIQNFLLIIAFLIFLILVLLYFLKWRAFYRLSQIDLKN